MKKRQEETSIGKRRRITMQRDEKERANYNNPEGSQISDEDKKLSLYIQQLRSRAFTAGHQAALKDRDRKTVVLDQIAQIVTTVNGLFMTRQLNYSASEVEQFEAEINSWLNAEGITPQEVMENRQVSNRGTIVSQLRSHLRGGH